MIWNLKRASEADEQNKPHSQPGAVVAVQLETNIR